MAGASVIYVDRSGAVTPRFTELMAATLRALDSEGFEVIAVVPNVGLSETLGVWIFYRQR